MYAFEVVLIVEGISSFDVLWITDQLVEELVQMMAVRQYT